ncbi:histidinol-phosphate transaminase, partial [Myxococcota bacterium]|nr:histidinol-phosphate transaminase [Myxococcota bacterium]
MSHSKFWSPIVSELEPYVPGEQPAGSPLKLNTNENPFPPSPEVFRAIDENQIDGLRLYPDPSSLALRQCIAEYYSTARELSAALYLGLVCALCIAQVIFDL